MPTTIKDKVPSDILELQLYINFIYNKSEIHNQGEKEYLFNKISWKKIGSNMK